MIKFKKINQLKKYYSIITYNKKYKIYYEKLNCYNTFSRSLFPHKFLQIKNIL